MSPHITSTFIFTSMTLMESNSTWLSYVMKTIHQTGFVLDYSLLQYLNVINMSF